MTQDPEPRIWGWTTGVKLEVLTGYLRAFTTASKRSPSTIYLDAFAGGPANLDRETSAEFAGSAQIALDTDPPFDTLRYFEMGPKAAQLEAQLKTAYPGRDIEVIEGDCNLTIPQALAPLNRSAATFAFIDPDGMEVRWPTLEALAAHKVGHSPFKVELWMLFTASGLQRTLSLKAHRLLPADVARADQLYGCHDWWPIYEARASDRITGRQAREEYVNLMRWRLERELGYRYTHAIEMKTIRGIPLYHMVFASDHPAGNDIMASLYRKAYKAWPEMRAERALAREHAAGRYSLFDDAGIPDTGYVAADATYVHEPTWLPIGMDPAAF